MALNFVTDMVFSMRMYGTVKWKDFGAARILRNPYPNLGLRLVCEKLGLSSSDKELNFASSFNELSKWVFELILMKMLSFLSVHGGGSDYYRLCVFVTDLNLQNRDSSSVGRNESMNQSN
ncbi:hypothetical protein O6P43_005764 [Quillaja saponaria]|uniref:Uncharacterized protein n=1 Tax=Quillaja saponaria TaxID=32244 RepID=A0AAD7VHE6_QUISA|nr:hypothetical protein O6P43_005764 [Quillaja saponaria]